MITAEQRRAIEAHAYVPEHLPAYVTAITGAQPYLFGDYLAYMAGERLIFVGYPLSGAYEEAAWLAALDAATERTRPRLTAITAAALPPGLAGCAPAPPDAYYRLDLADVQPDKKLRNLLRRAGRAVTVCEAARFGSEHRRLVAAFLAGAPLDDGTRFIFERVGRYAGGGIVSGLEALAGLVVNGSNRLTRKGAGAQPRFQPHEGSGSGQNTQIPKPGKPFILDARDAAGRLVAFDIATFSGEYAFYLFNFRARDCYVPGASDLLLARLIEQAQREGKRALNLGLGINAGISHFKEKWGAAPFLAHVSCVRERPRRAWEEALEAV